jgi:putative FmdB family regulatory protein
MPLYEYRCDACEHRFEIIQRFSDDPISVCPSCGNGPVVKLLSSPAIQFKGSGWYITDYARKGQGGSDQKSDKKDAGEGKSEKSPDSTAKTNASSPAAGPPAKD